MSYMYKKKVYAEGVQARKRGRQLGMQCKCKL